MPTESDRTRLAANGGGSLVTAGCDYHAAGIEIAVYILEDGSGRLELRRLMTDELVVVPMTTTLLQEVQRILDAKGSDAPCVCS